MNALEIIRQACDIIGITRPNSAVGSSDTGVRQLVGLLNTEGRELSARYAWEGLIREQTFSAVAAEDQGPLSDIVGTAGNYRYILNDTLFNRSTGLPIIGPKSPVDWQLMKLLGLSGPFQEYRIRGGHLLISPAPQAGETIAFEYVSRNWCVSKDGNDYRNSIENDEDEVLLDPEIMVKGLEWRWRKTKGLEYAEDFNSYERMVADQMSRDGTKRTISLAEGTTSPERRIAISPGSWPL